MTTRTEERTRAPLGPAGQLDTLTAQLERCAETVRTVTEGAAAAMSAADLDADGRKAALATLRSVLWRVSRDVLPLAQRVPPGLQGHPGYRDCLRASHALRELTRSALADHANWRIDLSLEPALGARPNG